MMSSPRAVRLALCAASLFGLGLAGITPALANSGLSSAFSLRYPASTTGTAAGCANTCHGGTTSTFNSYGRDLRLAAGTNDQRLAAIESLDSDKEGNSNLVEITKNAQPGWCVATTPGCDNNGRTPPASVTLLDPPPASNQPPVANAGGPYSAAVGAPVSLDGSASRDPDGSIASYAWNFGNGSTGSGVAPSATYATAGTFTVTLTVTDNGGATSQATTTVTVTTNTQPPVANAGGPYAGTVNVAISFNGAASRDPDGSVVSYLWNFGDSTTASGVTAVHAYAAAGSYTVRLTVTDNDGLTSSASTTAQVSDGTGLQPPVANPGGPYQGTTASPVAFDGSASSDPDGRIVSYDWTFGDSGTASGAKPTHAYNTAGTYTVTLTVTDDSGRKTTATTSASIQAVNTGENLYAANCANCHGDPWSGAAVDPSLPGLKRVAGARSCTITGAIFGTSVFPRGVPDMVAFGNQQLSTTQIDAIAGYLNSRTATGEQRYVATCAGCHGNDGRGGRVGEGVRGKSANSIIEAVRDERSMQYLGCLSPSDIQLTATFLSSGEAGNGGSGGDGDGGGGGSTSGTTLLGLLGFGLYRGWRRRRPSLQ
jgi:MYXO-CTERM domain-containing protein